MTPILWGAGLAAIGVVVALLAGLKAEPPVIAAIAALAVLGWLMGRMYPNLRP